MSLKHKWINRCLGLEEGAWKPNNLSLVSLSIFFPFSPAFLFIWLLLWGIWFHSVLSGQTGASKRSGCCHLTVSFCQPACVSSHWFWLNDYGLWLHLQCTRHIWIQLLSFIWWCGSHYHPAESLLIVYPTLAQAVSCSSCLSSRLQGMKMDSVAMGKKQFEAVYALEA